MNFCKSCGKELKKTDNYCDNCGQKVEISVSDINEENNNKSGLSNEKKEKYKKILIIVVVIFIIISIITSTDQENNNNSNENNNQTSNITNNNEITDSGNKSLEEKWNAYYKDNGIEVIDVDKNTLYNYGKYYKNKTILTGIKIEDISSSSIKANIENKESIFYSFVFNFEDKSEVKRYKKEESVIIIGEVSDSTTNNTVTLNKCHIVLSGNSAISKIDDLSNNESKYVEYAQNLESIEKQSQIDKENAEKNEYISKCNFKDYQDILRNPNNYKNQYIKVSGKVIQVSNGWFNSVTIRLRDSLSNIWYISYYYSNDDEPKILEDDNITVYGQSTGTTSYTTILGSQVTIPSIDAKYIDIN